MTDATLSKQSDVMPQMMQAYSNLAGLVQKGSRPFWEQQMQFLNSMEAFANGWFKRRHAGLQAALEACECMSQATTPQACLYEYQTWAAGAFERVMADCAACQREFEKWMSGIAPSLVPAIGSNQEIGAVGESRKRVRVKETA